MADNNTGYGVEMIKEQNHMTYYKLNEKTGDIIECPRLPSDSVFLKRYLKRGMVLDRSLLVERSIAIKKQLGLLPVEKSQEAIAVKEVPQEKPEQEVNPLECEICGFSAKNSNGLRFHMKKHNH